MSAGLTPTDALLSLAAASTSQERHAAFAAVVAGRTLLTPMDTTAVAPVVGDGGAGVALLGGTRVTEHARPRMTVAARVGQLLKRHEAARTGAPGPDGWAEVATW